MALCQLAGKIQITKDPLKKPGRLSELALCPKIFSLVLLLGNGNNSGYSQKEGRLELASV